MNFRIAVVAIGGLLVVGLLLGTPLATAETTKEWLVVSDADVGPGTLRWAIEGANDSPVDDVIRFASAMTIRPRSALPSLLGRDIAINGASVDWSPDIAPRVWIDGEVAGDAAGLELRAANGAVRGIGIVGFERYGIGVIGADATGARIEGNWIGLRANGRMSPNGLSGVAVVGGAAGARVINNRIGGNAVEGRTGHGVVVGGGGSVDALIEGNVIGIGPDGSPAPNDDGILVVDSAQATIRGNTIGHSKVSGIELRETRLANTVDANRIGVRRDGEPAPNDVGLFLGANSAGVQVGSRAANIVAGNRVGIAVEQGAREALIQNNWIGLAPSVTGASTSESEQPTALIRPNRERGISIIAGASRVRLVNNVIAAGDFGVVVDGESTTQVSLTRNAIAGARDGPTTAAIDVRSGAEISIGGSDSGLGNHVCGAEFGIRLANTEEPLVGANSVGAGFASRVRFDSDNEMQWGIRLDDRVLRARLTDNQIADASNAAISVVGLHSQENALKENHFRRNGIDIDLGADGSTSNDPGDRDRGPNGLLNHPEITSHTIEAVGRGKYLSTIAGAATPNSRVEIYVYDRGRERRVTQSARTGQSGRWEVKIPELPSGPLRALATQSGGATSEFSPGFLPSQRVELSAGVHWFVWTGPELPVDEGMSPILRWLQTVWIWRGPEVGWQGWSPVVRSDPDGLRRFQTGDVVRIQLAGNPPAELFVPAGGDLSSTSIVSLKRGFNSVSWLGDSVDAEAALNQFEQAEPDLMGHVWQWDGSNWELIWPRLLTAWQPGFWNFPVLWIRATRDGDLRFP